MQITNVRAVHVRIPLEKPYVFARGTMTAFDNVVVGIENSPAPFIGLLNGTNLGKLVIQLK